MSLTGKNGPWYSDGLEFTCTQCGRCCTGAPGYVWVSLTELEQLSEFMGVSLEEVTRQYVRQVGERYSLVEKSNHDCVFWDKDVGCTVYEARPTQCRTWPFWPAHLETLGAWSRVQDFCPGTRGGALHSVEEIQAQARRAASVLEE